MRRQKNPDLPGFERVLAEFPVPRQTSSSHSSFSALSPEGAERLEGYLVFFPGFRQNGVVWDMAAVTASYPA